MKLSRRCFLAFGIGTSAGITLSPLPWKITDDLSIWTQMWPWTPVPPDGAYSYVDTVCGLCPGGCGISVRKVDNRVIKIEGMKGHPVNNGGICILGSSGLQYLYNPNRVDGPMKRVGDRGAGHWEKITWKEAISEVSAKMAELREKGEPQRVAAISGKREGTIARLLERLLTVYGSPNFMTPESIEDSYDSTLFFMQGAMGQVGFDLEKADYVLSLGSGLLEGWGSPVRVFQANSRWKEKGKVVHADSILTNTAAKADKWLAVNPGTEPALAMGIAHVMIQENLFDAAFVNTTTSGFKEYKKVVMEQYSPNQVSGITGLDPSVITEIAREFAVASHPIALCGRGDGSTPGSVNDFMAVHALNALTGNINSEGGVWAIPKPDYINWPDPEMDATASAGIQKPRVDGAQSPEYPHASSLLNRFPKAIIDEKTDGIEVLLVANANPLYSMADTGTVRKAFDKIPFIVSFSSFMDETARNADLILPNHLYLERFEDIPTPAGMQKPMISLSKPVVEPRLNTRNLGDVIITLAKSLKGPIAKAFPWRNYKLCLRQTLADRWGRLYKKVYQADKNFKPDRWKYDTRTGKFEFVAFIMQNPMENQNGIPHFKPVDIGTGDGKEALTLIPYDSMKLSTGYAASTPFMLKTISDEELLKKDVLVQVNPKTAEKLGLSQGDNAELTTAAGKARVRVNLNDGIRPGVIGIPAGLGHVAFDDYMGNGKGVNANLLMRPVEDPVTGLDAAWGIGAKLTSA